MFSYVRHGCIPVIIQDGIDQPFERVGPGVFPGVDAPYQPRAAAEDGYVSANAAKAAAERVLDYSVRRWKKDSFYRLHLLTRNLGRLELIRTRTS